jgi:hypothetical protein
MSLPLFVFTARSCSVCVYVCVRILALQTKGKRKQWKREKSSLTNLTVHVAADATPSGRQRGLANARKSVVKREEFRCKKGREQRVNRAREVR